MKKKYATNSEKTYYYLRWFCMTALLLVGLSGIGSKVCGQEITAKIIVTADDPAIQHQVEFKTNQNKTTATLTFSNLPANKKIKTVKVKEGTAGNEVEATQNDKNTYTFDMPTPDNIYYVTVTTKEKDGVTYSITTNVVGVDKSLLKDLGESGATAKGASVTIAPQQTEESKDTGTIEIINITAHATDGSWTAIPADKDNLSSLTFNMPASNVIVTIYATISATGISISPDSKTLDKGESVQLTATILPIGATDKTVTWSSSNTSIASVDNNGKVTAVGPGTATITATANDGSGKTATCRITVNEPYTPIVHVTGISLDREMTTIKKGSILQLSATVTPSNADDKTVRWESSNTDVATVDDNGKGTAIAPGTVTITVTTTDQRKTATCSVTVTDIDTGIDKIDYDLRIYTSAGSICIDSPRPVDISVFSGTGSLLHRFTKQTACRIPASAGFYLVRVGEKTYKITL